MGDVVGETGPDQGSTELLVRDVDVTDLPPEPLRELGRGLAEGQGRSP